MKYSILLSLVMSSVSAFASQTVELKKQIFTIEAANSCIKKTNSIDSMLSSADIPLMEATKKLPELVKFAQIPAMDRTALKAGCSLDSQYQITIQNAEDLQKLRALSQQLAAESKSNEQQLVQGKESSMVKLFQKRSASGINTKNLEAFNQVLDEVEKSIVK